MWRYSFVLGASGATCCGVQCCISAFKTGLGPHECTNHECNHPHMTPALVLPSCILLFFSSGDWPQKHVVTSAMPILSVWKTPSPFWSCFNRIVFRFLLSHFQNIQAALFCQAVLFSPTTLFTSLKLSTLVISCTRSSSSSFGRRK